LKITFCEVKRIMSRILSLSLLLVSFLFILNDSKAGPPKPLIKSYHLQTDIQGRWVKQKLKLHIRRLIREGAPPLILTHALILNSRAMEKLGLKLWEAGYDVWLPNVRGHGNGKEKSTILPYTPKDYGFDKMLSEDLPLIINTIRKITKQKINLVGFSLGALLWEKYLSGVVKNSSGHLIKSLKTAEERSRQVRSFIALGIPLDLHKVNPQIRLLFFPTMPVFKNLHYFVPLTTNQDPEILFPLTIAEWIRRGVIATVKPIFLKVLPMGILTKRGIDIEGGELEELTFNSISQAHTDLVYDFIRWLWHPFKSRDGRVTYSGKNPLKTPSLFIFGEKDYLAPYKGSKKILRSNFPPDSIPKVLKFCEKAHLDLILTKALPQLTEVMIEFLKYPKEYKERNSYLDQIGNCF
jgi:pimeloyl-ACP methyl ester carboxylesterase